MSIAFSDAGRARVTEILGHYPDKEAALLQVLHIARAEFRTITPEVMEYIAGLLEIPPLRVMDVVSFYTLYPRQEEGRHVIQVCATLSCALLGAESLVDHLENKLGIKAGETTPDKKITLRKVECLGSCGTAPVMQINETYYENLTPQKVDEILANLP
ncbi:MAG TPA: NAD(P)H-dependent oxidoreductase subunit E [bacterium]|nr:NAD(P)H-dependent oxidoreductase subunit E [bacterium]HPR87019.1 NAD(P)H-dependent oxidoreductase subunit E [bacterium]